MTQTDLIIIGAGPGGYRAAQYAAESGLKVIIFEAQQVGGTCLNVGCIPTKSFARNAELVQTLKEADVFGLKDLSYNMDFAQVVNRKQQVVEALRAGITTLLSHPSVTLVNDHARFVDSHVVEDSKGERYTAPNIIIATGSVNKVLPGMSHFVTHEQLLSSTRLPQSLCIIGAGVIGMEFASIFSSFGVSVTVIEFLKECLPALDSDIAKRLRKVLEKRGVTFQMQCAVKDIKACETDGTKEVVFENKKGATESVKAEEVLMAVGRKPRVGNDFQQAGFDYDERTGIKTDAHFQTTVPGIYAIGDVNGKQMLAHAAEWQALQVVNHITGKPSTTEAVPVPAAIFTNPEAACVGLSEDQCKQQGLTYQCHKAFHRANGKALAMNETEGMLKLLCNDEGRIMGCHVFGAHAADMAQEVSVLMCRNTTIDQLRQMIHIHPTLSEIVLAATEN